MVALGVGFGDPTPQEKEKNIVVYVVLGFQTQHRRLSKYLN